MGYERAFRDQWTGSQQPEVGSAPHRVAAEASCGPGLAAAGHAALSWLLGSAVQRRELTPQGAGPLAPDIARVIDAQRGGGQPLPEPTRAQMEQHMGVGLSAVRIHHGPSADALNHLVQAEAFTTGTDVFFRSGRYDPDSAGGRELLAHELTHVAQQATGASGAAAWVSHPDDPAEVHARQVARSLRDTAGWPTAQRQHLTGQLQAAAGNAAVAG